MKKLRNKYIPAQVTLSVLPNHHVLFEVWMVHFASELAAYIPCSSTNAKLFQLCFLTSLKLLIADR